MKVPHLLFLGLAFALGAPGACGGVSTSDRAGSGASSGTTGGAAATDGGAEADAVDGGGGDGSWDANDGSDGSDTGADAPDSTVQSCAACSVKEYSCGQAPMESFDLLVSGVEADRCLVTNPQPYGVMTLHCEPLEVCFGKTCYPVAMDGAGLLTWTPPNHPKITCFPVK